LIFACTDSSQNRDIFLNKFILHLSNLATKAKVEPVANGINAYKDEKTAVATSVSLNTLKWF